MASLSHASQLSSLDLHVRSRSCREAAPGACHANRSNSQYERAARTSCLQQHTHALRRLPRLVCSAGDEAAQQPRVALEGDLVFVHFDCKDENGQVLETTRGPDMEPISFEVGAGELFANEMIKGFDIAVRGLEIGGRATIKASGRPWQKELMFQVPRDHPEVLRLEGRYKNVGGLAPELVVELANGSQAMVVEITDDFLRLDANSFVSGRELDFEIELVSFEPPKPIVAIDPSASSTTPIKPPE